MRARCEKYCLYLTSEPAGRKLSPVEQSRCTYPVHWDGVHRMGKVEIELSNGLYYTRGPVVVADR